ncbi:glycosyltransferase [Polynucleobacter sp. JS-Safj-400b-B2]|uniref:glycosyltransferase family 2 protein n=1 Tax=Polynucleobacter sp. JS-Safj-400b-B2 TaxID=2576921 RepID=UPI001C0C67A5|nr:glycosyltransferase family 2 protein [Polynucleobacter sp. JS-Safj-400b-B2]MBU3626725.1 glycosyltransferase [Polynucleobacter sp. JS-Safj-400b-B2]
MTISIIVPSYNSSAFLLPCLKSIQSRTNRDIKIHLIDNCSTDDTLQVALSHPFPGTSVLVSSQKDGGAAEAINKGFKLANSAIIGWLNSDDCYASGAIDRALKAFQENPKLMVVYGKGSHIDEAGKTIGPYPTLPPKTNINRFKDGSFICQPTVFFRRQVFSDIGYLDESLKTAFDFDFWLRIFQHYSKSQIGFIDSIQAYSRLHQQTLTRRFRQTVALESMKVISDHLGDAPAHWMLTYFDELCERYPFVDERESLTELLKSTLAKAKAFMKPTNFEQLIKTLQSDYRLILAKPQIFMSVQPDGWVSKSATIRFRYGPDVPRTLKLSCVGGWPENRRLNLNFLSSDGDLQKAAVESQEEFVIQLEAPETTTESYYVWKIQTRQSFVPAKALKKSKDTRSLSFKVLNLTIE